MNCEGWRKFPLCMENLKLCFEQAQLAMKTLSSHVNFKLKTSCRKATKVQT